MFGSSMQATSSYRVFKLVSAHARWLPRVTRHARNPYQTRSRWFSQGPSFPGNYVSFARRPAFARALGGIGVFILTIGSAYALRGDSIALEAPAYADAAPRASQKHSERLISFDELAKHNSVDSAWILVNGKVSSS